MMSRMLSVGHACRVKVMGMQTAAEGEVHHRRDRHQNVEHLSHTHHRLAGSILQAHLRQNPPQRQV